MPRVVTLLPAATEIVCALGAEDELVGVSHECDHPASVRRLPALTRPRAKLPVGSGAVDRAIRELVAQALSIYVVAADSLAALRPDVIVTQDLCEVCAVSRNDLTEALRLLAGHPVELVSLSPLRFADIFADVERVAAALHRSETGERLVAALQVRVAEVARRARQALERPRVVTLEWLDPVMLGGTWMPELVELAGGIAVGASAGQKAPQPSAAELAALDPEVVVVKPCGFTLEQALADFAVAARRLPLETWPAAAHGRIFVADGSSYFNRPGPRIVDSLEILAGCIHPDLFADLRRRYADAAVRVDAGGRLVSFSG